MSFKPSLLLMFFFTLFINVKATNYYINDGSTTNDSYTSAVGDDANNGTDPSTPKATLGDIFNDYNLGSGDIIYVDAGTYTETAVTVGSNDESFTIKGLSETLTIFDGGDADSFLEITSGDNNNNGISIEDLTIQDYLATNQSGSAIYITVICTGLNLDNVTFDNCDISNANSSYGGVIAWGSGCEGSTITIDSCIFKNNSAGYAGVFANHGISDDLTMTVTYSDFFSNNSDYKNAIYKNDLETNAMLTFTYCKFYANTSTQDGAFRLRGGTHTFTNCLFYENTSSSNEGVFWTHGTTTLNLRNCTFVDNVNGSLCINTTTTTTNIYSCIIQDNSGSSYDIDEVADGTTNVYHTIYNTLNGDLETNTNNETTDASFTDATNDDYSLAASSNGIDEGYTTGAPSDDITGATRVGTNDMGCYEYGTGLYTWVGTTDTDWKTGTNWDIGSVPGSANAVLIPTSGSYSNPPIINEADAVCGNMEMQGDAVLTCSSGKLTISGTVTMASTCEIQFDGGELECSGKFDADGIIDINSGTLDVDAEFELGADMTEEVTGGTIEVSGDWDGASAGDGGFTPTGGTVVFDGTSATNVDAHANANFYNVQLNKSSNGITVNSNLDINGFLQLTDGTLTCQTYTIEVADDFIITSGVLTAGTGTFTFDGAAAQYVNVTTDGGTTPNDANITFNNIVIDGSDVRAYYNKTNDRLINLTDLTINSGKKLSMIGQ